MVKYPYCIRTCTGYTYRTLIVHTVPIFTRLVWFRMVDTTKMCKRWKKNGRKYIDFLIVFQLSLLLLMKIADAVDKESKSLKHDDRNEVEHMVKIQIQYYSLIELVFLSSIYVFTTTVIIHSKNDFFFPLIFYINTPLP